MIEWEGKEGNLLTDEMEIDRRWEEYLAELYRSDFDNGLNDRDRDVRKDNPEVLRCEVRRIRHAKDEEWKIRR